MHTSKHRSAQDHIGKKVVIVGACTSGNYFLFRVCIQHSEVFEQLMTLLLITWNMALVSISSNSPSHRIQNSHPDVTMVQRGPTHIISAKAGTKTMFGGEVECLFSVIVDGIIYHLPI